MVNVLCVLLFLVVQQKEFSPTEVLENIRRQYTGVDDASAQFTQSVKLRYKQSAQKTVGKIKIKKGNQFSIETPQQTIVANGEKIWMYSPQTKQVIVDDFTASGSMLTPEKFLRGLPKDFNAVRVKTEGENITLFLEPLKKDNKPLDGISELKIHCKVGKWIVEKIEYLDRQGTQTTIELAEILFNKNLSDKDFQFIVTDEMKVVDAKTLQ